MNEVLPEFDELYDVFKDAASISMETRESAKKRWEANRAAYEQGENLSLDALKKKRLRHQLLTRLRDELDNLDSNYNVETQTIEHDNTIYAVDQSLIQTYARFNNHSQYQNFEFFHHEFNSENEKDVKQRRAYMLSLYSTIFRTGNMALLSADRSLLLDTLVFHRNQFEHKNLNDLERRIDALDEICKELSEVKSRPGEVDASKLLDTAFDQLIDSKSFSEVYEYMVPSRINAALRMGQWHNLFAAIQKKRLKMLAHVTDKDARKLLEDRWQLFSKVMRKAETDGIFMSSLRHDLLRCVKLYDISSTFERDADGKPVPQLNSNQVTKLVELTLEIHICNAALGICQLDCEIRYISPSRYLYDFKNGMGAGVNMPLVHPRVFNAYSEEREYKVIKRLTRAVFSAKSGFAGMAQQDDEITTDELKAIETVATRAKLQAFRTYAAFGANTDGILAGFAHAIERAATDLERRSGCTQNDENPTRFGNREQCERVSQITQTAKNLVKFFNSNYPDKTSAASGATEDTFQSLRDQVQETAEGVNDIYDDPYSALLTFLKEPGHRERAPRIAVRIVKSAGKLGVKRLICLPVTGAYRYNFSIPNCESLLNRLLENSILNGQASDGNIGSDFRSISINRFLEVIYECIEAGGEGMVINTQQSALLNFVKAIHAASYREWKLADHLCDEALGNIKKCAQPELDEDRKQLQMLTGEVYYLKHMALRGLADRIWRGKRKLRSLNFAALQLRNSMQAFEGAYADKSDSSGTMIFRMPMSFIAIAFEILTLKNELGSAITNVNDTALSTTAQFQKAPWGCSWLVGLSIASIWNEPEAALKGIKLSLDVLENKAIENHNEALSINKPDDRDEHLWAFRLMRARSMKSLYTLGTTIEWIPSGFPSVNLKELTRTLDRSLDRYEDFLRKISTDSGMETDNNAVSSFTAAPFSRILWGALDALSTQTAYVSIGNYFVMLDNESRLDPSGLPGRISRRLRSHLISNSNNQANSSMLKILSAEIQRMKELDKSE